MRRKKLRKLMSTVLSASMAVSMLSGVGPVTVDAAQTKTYPITTVEDFTYSGSSSTDYKTSKIQQFIDKQEEGTEIVLDVKNDLDFKNVENFDPIDLDYDNRWKEKSGVDRKNIKVVFKGNGFTFSNLTIDANLHYQNNTATGAEKNGFLQLDKYTTSAHGGPFGLFGRTSGVSSDSDNSVQNELSIEELTIKGFSNPAKYISASDNPDSGAGSATSPFDIGAFVGYGTNVTLKDCTLKDSEVIGGARVGGLAGQLGVNCKVLNCSVENSWIRAGEYGGAIVGEADFNTPVIDENTQAVIQNCTVDEKTTVTVSGKNVVSREDYMYLGGIAGSASAAFIDCTSKAKVQGYFVKEEVYERDDETNTRKLTKKAAWAGGIVGRLKKPGTITNCTNEGSVQADKLVGGIVGEAEHGTILKGVTNEGDVSGVYCVGGIAGKCSGQIIADPDEKKLTENNGKVSELDKDKRDDQISSTESKNIGGIVGQISQQDNDPAKTGQVISAVNNGEVKASNTENVGGVAGENYGDVVATTNSAIVTGGKNTGGIVGLNHGNIDDCVNEGNTKGTENVGGINGQNDQDGNVTDNWNKAEKIEGDKNTDEIIGKNDGNESNNKKKEEAQPDIDENKPVEYEPVVPNTNDPDPDNSADPDASTDPNASSDPNASTDPNASSDPNASVDPNASTDPNGGNGSQDSKNVISKDANFITSVSAIDVNTNELTGENGTKYNVSDSVKTDEDGNKYLVDKDGNKVPFNEKNIKDGGIYQTPEGNLELVTPDGKHVIDLGKAEVISNGGNGGNGGNGDNGGNGGNVVPGSNMPGLPDNSTNVTTASAVDTATNTITGQNGTKYDIKDVVKTNPDGTKYVLDTNGNQVPLNDLKDGIIYRSPDGTIYLITKDGKHVISLGKESAITAGAPAASTKPATPGATTAVTLTKNAQFSYGDYVYRVISVTSEGAIKNKVSLVGLAKGKKLKTIEALDMIVINGNAFEVATIGRTAFQNNLDATQVVIGSNITNIGNKAFFKCANVNKLTIRSKKIKVIGKAAFKGMKSLGTVKIKGNALTTIKANAFAGDNLNKLVIKSSKLRTIGASAFKGAKIKTLSLKSKNLTDIGAQAFANNTNLKKVVLKTSILKKLGKKAFFNIAKKAVVKVPKKNVKAYTKLFKKSGSKVKVTK